MELANVDSTSHSDETQTASYFNRSLTCRFQWDYTIVNFGRNEFRNCCRTTPTSIGQNEKDVLNLEVIRNSYTERERRARMLLGEKISACETCWKTERSGVRSLREDYDSTKDLTPQQYHDLKNQIDLIANHDQKVKILAEHGITYSQKTKLLEVVLSNTCDMQCMYCSHHYSSKWASERIKYGEIKKKDIEAEFPKPISEFKRVFLEWFKAEGALTVEHINFIGGEPTLIPEFYEISSSMSDVLNSIGRRNVQFTVVTNLNCRPAVYDKFLKHMLRISENFAVTDINVSIDAYGERAEYIRYGLNWERWQQNFEKLFQPEFSKISVSAQIAVNVLSVTSFPALLAYFWSLYQKYKKPIFLHQNMVTFPTANSPTMLTSDFVKYLDQSVEFLLEKAPTTGDGLYNRYGRWDDYAVFLTSIRNSIERHQLSRREKREVRIFFNTFNSRKSLNIYKVFPEYRNFFRQCGVKSTFEIQAIMVKNFFIKNWTVIIYIIRKVVKDIPHSIYQMGRIVVFKIGYWVLTLRPGQVASLIRVVLLRLRDPRYLYQQLKILGWHIKQFLKASPKNILQMTKSGYQAFKVCGWHVKQFIYQGKKVWKQN